MNELGSIAAGAAETSNFFVSLKPNSGLGTSLEQSGSGRADTRTSSRNGLQRGILHH